jgi:hypothetical protein
LSVSQVVNRVAGDPDQILAAGHYLHVEVAAFSGARGVLLGSPVPRAFVGETPPLWLRGAPDGGAGGVSLIRRLGGRG